MVLNLQTEIGESNADRSGLISRAKPFIFYKTFLSARWVHQVAISKERKTSCELDRLYKETNKTIELSA